MIQYDPMFDLKINVGHCDTFDLKVNVGRLTYILWSSDFALYLEVYLLYEHHTLGL